MKKTILTLFAVSVLLVFMVGVYAAPGKGHNAGCATIQDGGLVDSAGNPIPSGFDEFGYNYQAHMFRGPYDGYDRVWGNDHSDYADDTLIMKWSDAWLANVDCNGDGKLDRGLVDGVPSGTSKGWLTNHLEGDYTDTGGNTQHYTDFVKIAWVGPVEGDLWGQYTILQEVYNDPAAGDHGLLLKSTTPGFGLNDHWTTL